MRVKEVFRRGCIAVAVVEDYSMLGSDESDRDKPCALGIGSHPRSIFFIFYKP